MMVLKCLIHTLFCVLWAQKLGKTESQGKDVSEVIENIGPGRFY